MIARAYLLLRAGGGRLEPIADGFPEPVEVVTRGTIAFGQLRCLFRQFLRDAAGALGNPELVAKLENRRLLFVGHATVELRDPTRDRVDEHPLLLAERRAID